jgi:glycosyltransferase involved in cell wall biosynthesis
MKILIFNQYFWPENFRINELACSLKLQGHNVEVMTSKPNYPDGYLFPGYSHLGNFRQVWKGIIIHRLPIITRGYKSSIRLALNYFSYLVAGLFLAPWILRRKKYDVIFVYAPSPIFQVIPASFLGWIKGVPVVLWVQDLWPESAEATGYVKSTWVLKLLEKLVRFSYAHTDLILVQSRAFVDYVSKLAPKIPVLYYPNSVDKDFYTPKDLDGPYIDSLTSGFTVLFAGNVGEAQSMETIVSAAEELLPYKEIKIVIIGSGSKIDWLSKEIKQKSLENIFLEGRYPVETMPALMRKASVLLVSLTNQPIFGLTVPNKVQAYLAVGRPIIASLNGEGARIINEAKTGFSVPAEDAKGLAEAILTMYRMSDEQRSQLGENGRAYFKSNFDGDKLIYELIGHFKRLVAKKDNH